MTRGWLEVVTLRAASVRLKLHWCAGAHLEVSLSRAGFCSCVWLVLFAFWCFCFGLFLGFGACLLFARFFSVQRLLAFARSFNTFSCILHRTGKLTN